MTTKLDFPVFDADNHLCESEDSLTRFLLAECCAGTSSREIMRTLTDAIPALREPRKRLEMLDHLNIDRTLMFPTLPSSPYERTKRGPSMVHAASHALNEWMCETWTFNFDDRIFAAPIIPLLIVDMAIEELDWCLERGARTVLIQPPAVPGLQGSRSFALPEFDPFWQRVIEAGIPVSMHGSATGCRDNLDQWENLGQLARVAPNSLRTRLQGTLPIVDAMAALVCQGALDRNPGLKVLCVGNGGDWVDDLFTGLTDTYENMPHAFPGDPIAAFKGSVWMSPFHDDDLVELIELIGVDHVLFGSEYPHPEGNADPFHYTGYLPPTLTDDEIGKIMGGNLERVMDMDMHDGTEGVDPVVGTR